MEELSSGGPEQKPGVRVRREMGRCSGCAFWDAQNRREDDIGLCRRHSPRSVVEALCWRFEKFEETMPRTNTWWPTTERIDFCGDYFPIEIEVE